MLVRLLGKEEEALAGEWELPFTDVAKDSTAYPYIGYAYANGLTNGTSATTYSGSNPIKPNQYITFVLRSLGYVSGEDFSVGTAWDFSDKIGLTDGSYSAETKDFTRGDVAMITLFALTCTLKDSDTTLFSVIQKNGVIPKNADYSAPQKLKYQYCNDWGETVSYDESYIQSATVSKIGNLYLFRIALKSYHFYYTSIFPAGCQDEDDEYCRASSPVSILASDNIAFLLSDEFIFKNPIDHDILILRLNPVLDAFPEGFRFAEGCDFDAILAKIKTSTLPK